jgi:outer membrane immunogenic protein
VGGGLEYGFSGAWSAKIEYLYVDLGNASCDATTCGISTDVSFKANVIRAGVNYRFY